MRCQPAVIWLGSLLALSACARDHRGDREDGKEEEVDAGRDGGAVLGDASAAASPDAALQVANDAAMPEASTRDCPGILPPRQASEDVHKAVAADDRCSVHADCQVRSARVSCTRECPRAALSARGVMQLEQRLGQIEAELCKPYFSDPVCPRGPITQNCSDSTPAVARCVEGHCVVREPGCGNGCVLVEGSCRGDAHCDGCPAVVQDFVGMACAPMGRVCAPTGFCPPTIRCRDDDGDGSANWVEEVLLCSAQREP
jgi:hypothetical protein